MTAVDGFQVGSWSVIASRNALVRDGRVRHVEPKAVEVLVVLAERAGDVVTRDELLARVWPGVVVGDDVLTQAVIKLRKALGDDARRPAYIETIAKRGYRLLAPVGVAQDREAAPAPRRRAPLRRLVAVVASIGVALCLAAVVGWRGGAWTAIDAAAPPLVQVMPFGHLGDPPRPHFSDGLTDDLVAALGRFADLRVLTRHAAPVSKAVRYVVRGSVREVGGELRVVVELSDGRDGALLWSQRYDGADAELFTIQDRIVRDLAGALAVKLERLEQARVASAPPGRRQAYDLVLQARSLTGRTERAANRRARALLAQALELDPDHGAAHVALAAAEYQRAIYGWTEDAVAALAGARSHARRALASGDDGVRAGAHALLGHAAAAEGRLDEALDEAARALALNPSDAQALYVRGSALLWSGHLDGAIADLEAAWRFDPALGGGHGVHVALAYYAAGRDADALAAADRFLARHPDFAALQAPRAAALARLGRSAEAAEAARALRRHDPFFRVDDWGSRFVVDAHRARLQDGLRSAGL